MTKTAYFDVNVCIDVFEQTPDLFSELEGLVHTKQVDLFVSDIDLAEIFKGTQADTFEQGIERLMSLSPNWIFLADLANREVRYEYALHRNQPATPPFRMFPTWQEFLPLITSQEERASVSGNLQLPSAAALRELYPPNSIKEHLKEDRKPELAFYGKEFPEILEKATTRRQLHRDATAHVLKISSGKAASISGFLWNRPDRAPSHRLNLELTFEQLDSETPTWKVNDFFDIKHAGALPYVDVFVTRDSALRERLKWYDENVRLPHDLPPYMLKVCSTWDEFVENVSPP